MVMQGSSKRNYRGKQIEAINARALQAENQSIGKSNESHAFTPVQYNADMSQSLSRMSSRETQTNDLSHTRDGRLPGSKKRSNMIAC